ncbi:hypothetical protein E7T09_00295 [Deinococcus sp. KSM4-11]|uniref:hypothetical protein n=1 Tax=Deinococcus sp. KSM4-11 TaxID=2568654 RepID=UPI0010A49A64|nr:hypothetical protein [Deinococcus sp. KSM4-11]THF87723.1 hypothetical protein E7T09_00295 [Deinococcus sp. KSM4-11]
MVNPVAVQRDLFRPVLLACQAELRLQHPQDVTLRVDLNSLGMSRYVERDDQRRWEVDGVVELRGERTSFDCDAVGSGQALTVTFATSLLWAIPPPD